MPFESSSRQTSELLELVHSDGCEKISEKLTGGAQYFLTFTDDRRSSASLSTGQGAPGFTS